MYQDKSLGSSKILTRRWLHQNHEIHKEKLREIKGGNGCTTFKQNKMITKNLLNQPVILDALGENTERPNTPRKGLHKTRCSL